MNERTSLSLHLHLQIPNPTLLHPNPIPLMPLLQTTIRIPFKHDLLPLRPPRPLWLLHREDTHQFLRRRQLRVDGRRERVDQLGPGLVPQPQHGAAVGAEGDDVEMEASENREDEEMGESSEEGDVESDESSGERMTEVEADDE